MFRPRSNQEMAELRLQVNKVVNITITILSIAVVVLSAFLLAMNIISGEAAGIIIPIGILVYLLMGMLSNWGEKRKPVLLIYAVCMILCAIVLIFDIVWVSVM